MNQVLFALTLNACSNTAPKAPNIVFILIDDLGFEIGVDRPEMGYKGGHFNPAKTEIKKRDELLHQLMDWRKEIKAPIPTIANPEYHEK